MREKRACTIGGTMGQAMERVACSRATTSVSYFIMCGVNSQSNNRFNVLLNGIGGAV